MSTSEESGSLFQDSNHSNSASNEDSLTDDFNESSSEEMDLEPKPKKYKKRRKEEKRPPIKRRKNLELDNLGLRAFVCPRGSCEHKYTSAYKLQDHIFKVHKDEPLEEETENEYITDDELISGSISNEEEKSQDTQTPMPTVAYPNESSELRDQEEHQSSIVLSNPWVYKKPQKQRSELKPAKIINERDVIKQQLQIKPASKK